MYKKLSKYGQYSEFFFRVGPSQKFIIVACNGKAFDYRWIWKLIHLPNKILSTPPHIR